jgi:DNA invertase Pin-like site-specific DNA recombinase
MSFPITTGPLRGTPAEPGPGWAKVKARIADGDIGVLVMWEQSRAQRDLRQYAELRDLLRSTGTKWCYSGRLVNLDDPGDSMTSAIEAVMAEHEAEQTSKRIRRATRAQAAAGRPHGPALYGYERVYDPASGALVGQTPVEAEAAIVREIFERIARRESIARIVADLEGRNVPTRGKPWKRYRIGQIVTNRGYIAKRVHRGQVIGPAAWPAIVDESLFVAANAVMSDPERQKSVATSRVRWLLGGIARCGLCGGPMQYGRDRGVTRVYRCKPGGGHLSRAGEALDEYVTGAVLERLERGGLDLTTPDDADAAAAARAEAVMLRARLDAAADQYAAGKLTAPTLARIEARLLADIADAEVRARATIAEPVLADLAGPGVEARWDALDITEQREAVRLLVDVIVHPDPRRGHNGFNPDAIELDWK